MEGITVGEVVCWINKYEIRESDRRDAGFIYSRTNQDSAKPSNRAQMEVTVSWPVVVVVKCSLLSARAF